MQPASIDQPGVIRVMLADDHRITLWGLKQLVESASPRLRVVGAVSTRDELLAHPGLAETDVVLLDLDLGGVSGAEAIAAIGGKGHARVLVLTAEDDPTVYEDAVLKGARGVVHKSAAAELVLRAIEKVHAGEIWLDGKLMGQVLGRLTAAQTAARHHVVASAPAKAADELLDTLTPRERQIVETMVRMSGDKLLAVADRLLMSEHTLRNHLTTIYSKLRVRGRLELHVLVSEQLGARSTPAPPP